MKKWAVILLVLLGIYLIGSIIAVIAFSNDGISGDKIVVLPLNGPIVSSGDDLFNGNVVASELVKKIDELGKDDSVKGVIFEIDSPGGTVVASQDIADAINKLNKTSYAVIRDVGASGAYWIASATDKIYASPMSITGSIGVIGSYLEFSELFDKYGVHYERLIGGKYKDVGSPYRNLTEEERELLQNKIDLVHEYFILEVARNRNLSVNRVRDLATGEIFLGVEAKELGLIDELGDRETAIKSMKQELNITKINIVEEKRQKSFFETLFNNGAYFFGKGFGSSIAELQLSEGYEIRA